MSERDKCLTIFFNAIKWGIFRGLSASALSLPLAAYNQGHSVFNYYKDHGADPYSAYNIFSPAYALGTAATEAGMSARNNTVIYSGVIGFCMGVVEGVLYGLHHIKKKAEAERVEAGSAATPSVETPAKLCTMTRFKTGFDIALASSAIFSAFFYVIGANAVSNAIGDSYFDNHCPGVEPFSIEAGIKCSRQMVEASQTATNGAVAIFGVSQLAVAVIAIGLNCYGHWSHMKEMQDAQRAADVESGRASPLLQRG